MTDLPRARALVRLDGPGHIMPIEPVTPPDSRMWRVIHLPAMLAVVAISLLLMAALAIGLFSVGYRFVAGIPGAHVFYPAIGAGATVATYLMFVRIVERRPTIEELGAHGWLQEFALGYLGGLVLSLATLAIMVLLGGIEVTGFYPVRTMITPFVIQLTTAIVLELIVCGLGFRLVERLLGSWFTLLLTAIFFGAARLLGSDPTPFAVLAVVIEAALLFAALYMVTRRLWAAIGLNAAWKLAQIALYGGASPDGIRRLVIANADGPDWLTGGRGGADTSVPALCVNALALGLLLTIAVRRGRVVRPVWRRARFR